MDVSCPKRKYGDLKKVSLAYQEGFFQPDNRVQFCCFLVGSAGPEFLVVSSTTKGTRQPTPPDEAAGWGHVESLGMVRCTCCPLKDSSSRSPTRGPLPRDYWPHGSKIV